MSVAYSCVVDKERRLGEIALSHSVNERELIEAMKELYESPEWKPDFSTLWDGTNITELVIGQDGLQEIVSVTERLQDGMGPGKVALVFRRKMDETMAKIILYMTPSTMRERRLFRTRQDALEWLFG